jgi:hypothetical protein
MTILVSLTPRSRASRVPVVIRVPLTPRFSGVAAKGKERETVSTVS